MVWLEAADVRLRRSTLLVALLATQALLLVVLARDLLLDDSWLSLVDGRFVWQHGIPHADTLGVLTHGREWVDQQWLAQLAFYGVDRVGGLGLLFALDVVLVTAALAAVMRLARRRGASTSSVFAIGLVALLAAPWAWQPRAQSFAALLFTLLLALLLGDPDASRRRTLLALPLLVLWANVHGSVLLGVGVTVLYALFAFRRRAARLRRYPTLLLVAPFSVLCTPYGTTILDYYYRLLGNRDIATLAPEWRAPTGRVAVPFAALAIIVAITVVRRRRELSAFPLAILLLTLAASLTAVRHIPWFALTSVATVPPLLRLPEMHRNRANAVVGWAAAFALAGVAAFLAAKPDAWYEQHWPTAAAAKAATLVATHPRATVFVHGREDDWLLWHHPALAGHIAYDARLELLTGNEIAEIVAFDHDRTTGIARPFTLVWLNAHLRPHLARTWANRRPVAFRTGDITLLAAARH